MSQRHGGGPKSLGAVDITLYGQRDPVDMIKGLDSSTDYPSGP